jgi:hypothetical protein
MHFKYFGAVRQSLGNPLIRGRFIAADGNKGQKAQPESLWIHLRAVTPYHAAGFELANPLQDGGRRQSHCPGNVHLGFSGVCLKLVQDLKVNWIEVLFERHDRIISAS